MKFHFLSLVFILLFQDISAQPKREMRAVWIAHVNNIDFPSSANMTEAQQKDQFISILDDFAKNNINAAIVQIRTNCDASYPSELEPWSAFWAGKQGTGPGYDPLAFMIEECHQRNIEFHAWFNPYRAAPSLSTFADNKHVRVKHPDWILSYNGLQMLNPALPEVREYVSEVILDVVQKYDIDAVHFDDYFYPYPVSGVTLNDDASFSIQNRGFSNRADWRRDNINLLIKMMSENIKKVKPWVKFGISPFGIWKNKSASQPDASDTKGLEAFHSIYADSKKWIQEGWVDYLAPQVYWSIGFSIANFGILVPWWAENKGNFNRHLFIGHAAYRINSGGTDPNWAKPSEMPQQINFTRNVSGVNGSIFYNTTSFRNNLLGFNDSLKSNHYKTKAFVPTMPWIDSVPPAMVTGLKIEKSENGYLLKWDSAPMNQAEMDKINYYAIYRNHGNNPPQIENNEQLIAIVGKSESQYSDKISLDKNYMYSIIAFDRLHNESIPAITSTAAISNTSEEYQNPVEILSPYPNPFSKLVSIKYCIHSPSKIRIDLFDQNGKWITTLDNSYYQEGWNEMNYDGSHLHPGIYYLVLTSPDAILTKKVIKSAN